MSLRITWAQKALAALWWGPARPWTERVARRLLGGGVQIRSVRTGPLAGRPLTGGLAEVLGVYELPVQRRLLELVRSGDTVWDVGANHGYLTLLAATATGPRGRVVAFEPVPELVADIRRAVAASGPLGERVQVEAVAVADRVGTDRLHLPDAATAGARASLVNGGEGGGETIEVAVTSLDAYAEGAAERPAVVKVDVEGAEVRVLDGAPGLLGGADKPRWLIEVHGPDEHRRVIERLVAHGYHWEEIPPRRGNGFPRHVVALPGETAR